MPAVKDQAAYIEELKHELVITRQERDDSEKEVQSLKSKLTVFYAFVKTVAEMGCSAENAQKLLGLFPEGKT
jgi:hypothetical protein